MNEEKGPRLYLKPPTRPTGVWRWFIRDKEKMIGTGYTKAEVEKARVKLAKYIIESRTTPRTRIDQDCLGDYIASGAVDKPAKSFHKKSEYVDGFIYFAGFGDYVKIGYSVDVDSRMKTLQTGFPMKLVLFLVIRGTPELEKQMHKKFVKSRLRGEWFKLSYEVTEFMVATKSMAIKNRRRSINLARS